MPFHSNYHSHNVFCDGRATMENFAKFAIANGLKKYGFSSHSPLPFTTSWNMELDSYPYYIQEFKRVKEKYKDEIELYIGLEIDYIEGLFGAANNSLYSTKELDYLISSVHYLDKLPDRGFFSVDGNFFDFKQNVDTLYQGDIKIASKRYFEIVKNMLEHGGFDVVGHLDKISLNGSRCKAFNKKDRNYIQTVSEILELIKNKGYILEINTKSYLKSGFTYPDEQFFPLIKELDIPIIVSSDCHYPDKITDGFDEVYPLLKKAGINEQMEIIKTGWRSSKFDV